MFIIDDKVFIHLHKCGGMSIKSSLFKNREKDLKFMVRHQCTNSIPDQFRDYERIALVRNPLTWYRSFYYYTIEYSTRSHLLQHMIYKRGKARREFVTLEEFMNRSLRFSDYCKRTDYIGKFRKFMSTHNNHFSSAQIGDMTSFDPPETFYQFHFDTMIDDTVKLYHLESEFDDVCEILKIPSTHTNKSSNSNIKTPLDESIQKLILEKDEILFDKMKYHKEIIV